MKQYHLKIKFQIVFQMLLSPKLPNLLKMISHLLLTVLTNFSRNVTLNVWSRATAIFCFRAVRRQFTKEKNENL
jgi:hypothetical protein